MSLSSIGNVVSTGINAVYWMFRGSECLYETFVIAKDLQTLQEKDQECLKDYARVAFQVGTCVLDLYVLKKDWDSSTLENQIKVRDKDIKKFIDELNKNKALSVQFQQMALMTDLCHNSTNGYFISSKTLYRMVCLARKNGQIPTEYQKTSTPTVLVKSTILAATGSIALDYFDTWYEIYGPNAPKLDLNTDYEDIPEAHHANSVFSQFKCPIDKLPIRFPVTAPSTPGHPGHHYERKAIISWLTTHNVNPITKEPLHLNQLRENLEMRQIIENEINRLKNLGIYD